MMPRTNDDKRLAGGELRPLLKTFVSSLVKEVPTAVADCARGQPIFGVCVLQQEDDSLAVVVFTEAMLAGRVPPSTVWEEVLSGREPRLLRFESGSFAEVQTDVRRLLIDGEAKAAHRAAVARAVEILRQVPWFEAILAPWWIVFTCRFDEDVSTQLWRGTSEVERKELASVRLLPEGGSE
jgi:hypothetical protein